MVEMTLDMDISFQKHPPSTYEVKTGESYSRCREGSSSQIPPFISYLPILELFKTLQQAKITKKQGTAGKKHQNEDCWAVQQAKNKSAVFCAEFFMVISNLISDYY
jgi:hypothetical protein